MIKFNRLPPQNSDDVELSHYTRRELSSTLDFHKSHLAGHRIDGEMSSGAHFKINGSEVGTTICANLRDVEPADRIALTKALAEAALLKAFEGLDYAFIQLYLAGAQEGAESEILGEQMDQLERQL